MADFSKIIEMPLPSTVGSGDKRAKSFKRDNIKFQPPDAKQNEIVERLQINLSKLALCGTCCSKAQSNRSCLFNAFTSADGDFDFPEAKKCFLSYFDQYCNLNEEDWKTFAFNEFTKCCQGHDDKGSIIHSFNLTYVGLSRETKDMKVCRRVWSYFMGENCTKHRMQVFAESFKKNLTPTGAMLTDRQDYGDSTMHDTNLQEINQYYVEAQLENDDKDMLKMGTMRRTQCETFLWFKDHFDLTGDFQPNSEQVHLDHIEKTEIYDMYVNEIGSENALCYSSWRKFWSEIFPEVNIRAWKNVTGKCKHCGYINAGRRTAKSPEEIAAFRKLHILHKSGLFMMERLSYHQRRAEAEADDTVFSGIIDIMDNNHCQCPYEANQHSFPQAIHQLICGFLQHGKKKKITVYRGTGKPLRFFLKNHCGNFYVFFPSFFSRIVKQDFGSSHILSK